MSAGLSGVCFDLGGVVLESPFTALSSLEATRGAAPGSINAAIAAGGPDGAWARHERGLVDRSTFLADLDVDLAGVGVTAAEVVAALDGGIAPRQEMLDAISRIRDQGLRTAAITNTWWREDGTTAATAVAHHFDVVVESAVEGVHKPDPAIYRIALDRLGLAAEHLVFLDDIGRNLKAAKALGFRTIRVEDPTDALVELGEVLGIDLA